MKMQMKNSRLVVTGMGAVTPIGIGVDAYWNNLVQGVCGVDAITRFDTENLPVKIAAEVKDFDPLAFMRDGCIYAVWLCGSHGGD